MGKTFTKDRSETLYNKFMEWRERLLQLTKSIIIVEGKRDVDVLHKLGTFTEENIILSYSQKSFIKVEELIRQDTYKNYTLIPLVDYDRQGEEYLSELQSMKAKMDLELRRELRNLTRGKLIEFEDLLYVLKGSRVLGKIFL